MDGMRKTGKLEALFMALALIFFGAQGILSGEVPAFKGKLEPVLSIPFKSPLVPWLGCVLVCAGIYVLVRFFVWRKK
jgi:hypothetical protein